MPVPLEEVDLYEVKRLLHDLLIQLTARANELFPPGVAEDLAKRAARVTFHFRPNWPDGLLGFALGHCGPEGVERLVTEQGDDWGVWGDSHGVLMVARRSYALMLANLELGRALTAEEEARIRAHLSRAFGPEPAVQLDACPHEGTCKVDEIDCPRVEPAGDEPEGSETT